MQPNSDVFIRPLEKDDANALFNSVKESYNELQPWMPWCHANYSIDDSVSWIEKQISNFRTGEEFNFAICVKDDFVGVCGLNAIDRTNLRANLGYWVRSSATGRSVATQTTRLLAHWAFENTELNRLEIVIAVGNFASIRVAEKSGAISEGILRSRLMLHSRTHDAVVYSIIRGDETAA